MKSKSEIEFEFLMERRPSIYGNSIVMLLFKALLWLSAAGFLVLGITLSVSTVFDSLVRTFYYPAKVNLDEVKLLLASTCFLLFVALSISVWIGRMLIRRNAFLAELDVWYKEKKDRDKAQQK